MIRAVLFDMDGLMFDTERLATETWMELGRRHGIPVTRELMDETRGDRWKTASGFLKTSGTGV